MGSIVELSQVETATAEPQRDTTQALKTFGSQFPVVSNAHSKTLDAGCDGRTFSCNPVGDVSSLAQNALQGTGLCIILTIPRSSR